MNKSILAAIAAGAALLASPVLADVKAGVDAWSRGDYRKAVEEWRGPAVAGDADAQFNLGQAYKLGRGVPVDLGMAEQWYGKAAAQGHPQAEENYGLALFQNNKRGQAIPWLQKASQRGEPRAQFVLGTMYFNGDVVAKDWVRAYALITRASAAGLPQASQSLAQMDRYITLTDRQQGLELARKYEQEAGRPQLASNDVPTGPGRRPTGPVRNADLPPSSAYQPDAPLLDSVENPPAYDPPPPPVRTPRPPRPAPVAEPAPVRANGGWRVQLGAFGDPNNARKLWGQVSGRFAGRQPYYVKAGSLTKLLVGPFASSGEASRACAAVKPCVPVGP
jgi:cell division protein FtsN